MADDTVLAGELGLLSLFDLGQLFLLNGTTGQLSVTSDGRRGYFYFDRGMIVNAVDDEYHEGEGAAYRLFTWRSGSFEFRATPPSGARAITEGTEGLMMEAARRMDESGESAGSGGLATERLQQRAGALEALREAFQSVASESGAAAEDGSDPDGSPFAMLREPSDALLFRPGHAPRLFHQGRWRDSGTQVLDPAAYDQLRARLLDGAAGAGAQSRSTGVHTLVVPHEDGRYVVTRVGGAHEALWVRAAGVTPAEPLEGPMDALHALLEMPSGLVIVGGPDGESADRFLHACVAELTHRRASTVLLAADHGRWQHEDGAGALVRVTDTDLEAMLRTLAPEVAVFDHAHAHASLAALPVTPLVLVSVVAPDAQALVSRWCARVGRRWGDGIETQLAVAPLGIGFAAGVRQSGGRIVFAAAPLSFAQPAQAAVIAPTPTPATVDAASGAQPEPAPANAALAPAARSVAVTAPIVPTLPPASAAPEAPEAAADATAPVDSMAALAAELTRTLHKAA